MKGQGRREGTPNNLPLFHSPVLAGMPVAVYHALHLWSVGLAYNLQLTVGCTCRSPLGSDSVRASVGQDCSCRVPRCKDSSCWVLVSAL